ncbi:MAG TPA: hypothetical protein VHX66_06485 [Solirubrobacteraceae bacterium]|jgi:hypothetical protein|nr:hypothetical protein [Solirubrobacteraceae bacterium]
MSNATTGERETLEDLARTCHEASVALALGDPLQVAAASLALDCERRLGYRVPPIPPTARVLRLVRGDG